MNLSDNLSKEQLALLQKFFEENHAQCFWSWNPRITVKEENAGRILKMARTHGGPNGYALATRINELNQK